MSTSEDNSTVLVSTTNMQQERTLNYSLERGWCIQSVQSGASTIVALVYDSGTAILRIGDFAPLCAFNSSNIKQVRAATSGQFQHQYSKIEGSLSIGGIIPKSSQNIATCNNFQKALQ